MAVCSVDDERSFMGSSSEHGEEVRDPISSNQSNSQPLYEGAPSDLTIFKSYLLLFQYAVRHSLTAKALQELLHLISVFLPSGAMLPKSVHQLKALFTELFPEQQPKLQNYCSVCHRLYDDEGHALCTCHAGVSQFVTVSVAAQLKSRLESKFHGIMLHALTYM